MGKELGPALGDTVGEPVGLGDGNLPGEELGLEPGGVVGRPLGAALDGASVTSAKVLVVHEHATMIL